MSREDIFKDEDFEPARALKREQAGDPEPPQHFETEVRFLLGLELLINKRVRELRRDAEQALGDAGYEFD